MPDEEESKEWQMVEELFGMVTELEPNEQEFIAKLYDHLDPHSPVDPTDPNCELSEKQLAWLYKLFAKYCNEGDDDDDFFE